MIIKNISIKNFRSYYGDNSIDIGDGLTLIIGANGDGKTTFFEALEWLFDTVGKYPKLDSKFISKKRCAELFNDESDFVKVSMTYIINNSSKIFEKSFRFYKTVKGDIIPSNPNVTLYIKKGSEKDSIEGVAATSKFDRDFAASVRKYSLFKGEQDLNIFNKEEALSYLVETFSQVRDFDPYLEFMEIAKKNSERATDNAMKADRINRKEAERLRNLISQEEKAVGDRIIERDQCLNEANNYKTMLDNIEQSREASKLLVNTNNRIESLSSERNNLLSQIKENYTFRLLDDMWILLGFQPIAQQYAQLVSSIDIKRRKEQSRHDQEIGAKKLASKMQEELNNGFVPLALNVPDENTMREMLNEEVCKVCGRPAPKGSPAYNHMKKHLEDYLASLKEDTGEDDETIEPPLYKNDFVSELTSRYSVMHNNMRYITNLNSYIEKEFAKNFKLHEKIDKIEANLEHEEEVKKKILAQTEGLTEDQLISNYQNINEWWQLRTVAENRAEKLKSEIDKHQLLLDTYREDYSKIAEESTAAMYNRTSAAIRRIFDAFVSAKNKNRRDFLNSLEKESNTYLEALNKGDFRGKVQIDEKPGNSAEIKLIDSDGSRIYNPNTALKTTMYMSLLFAVAKLTTIKHENDYPLIFDAPTSSFTAAKESDFFGVIGNIKKQTIIVTKSFLIEDENGNSKLDKTRLAQINAKQYRIEKKKPFDEEDLTTIQTTITKLN
jgi:DNA sulfur modification protein DndD